MSPDANGSPRTGGLVVFAAPSGSGKSTIINKLTQRIPRLEFSISATTRPRRQGEIDGVTYDFMTDEEFRRAIERNEFIEWEEIHGFLYGTRKSRIEEHLARGSHQVFDVDVLGALSLKRLFPHALLIYLDVPSVDVLRERLLARGRENEQEIERRLERYRMERAQAEQFDRIVMNDDLDDAVEEVVALVQDYIDRLPLGDGEP